MKIKINDSIIVRKGVQDPDFENLSLSGWSGRINEIVEEYTDERVALINIEWNSKTLKQIPDKYIQECETEGLDWQQMNLYVSDIEINIMADKTNDIKKTQKKLEEKHHWAYLGDSGKRISNILEGIKPEDEWKCFIQWDKYLKSKLEFPFQALVEYSENNWLVKEGDIINIKKLSEVVDMYGIIAKGKIGKKTIEFPLCDLEIIEKKHNNYKLIDDYRVWFSNR